MDNGDFWTTVRDKGRGRRDRSFGTGALRVALLFGTVAIAVAGILTPLVSARVDHIASRSASYDTMSTGSIAPSRADRTYTVRRSITQPMPDAICIIDANGRKTGSC